VGRPPIGKVAMTDAERQRRRRERLRLGLGLGGGAYLPAFLPWDQERGRRDPSRMPGRAVSKFIDELDCWLADGDLQQVAAWLASSIDAERWRQIDALVRARHEADMSILAKHHTDLGSL